MKNLIFIILMCLVVVPVKAEKNLMRLFYTPAERALIDVNKQAVKTPVTATRIEPERTAEIEVKGFLKRKDKPDVVWVNTSNTLKSNKPLSDVKVLKVYSNGKVKIRVSGQGTAILKPGQVISRGNKEIRESYE